MGIEDKQKMSRTREGGKPRWRYHWGNYVPEGLVWGETEVWFIDGSRCVYCPIMDKFFVHSGGIGNDPRDIIAYRIK